MKEKSSEYVEISTTVLKRFDKPLIFDIYVKRTATNYSKLFKKEDIIDWKRIEQYEGKGVKMLCVLRAQYERYLFYVEQLVDRLLNSTDKFSIKEGIVVVREMINGSLTEIMHQTKVSEHLAVQAGKTVSGCIEVMGKDTLAFAKIIGQMVNRPYIFKHSVTVSLLSILIAQKAEIESQSSLNFIGLGALLHDIGISRLDFDPEEKQTLTPEELKEMWRHPELGKRLLDPVKSIRTEVLDIILQHHEQPNGHGYPNGLRGGEIFLPAKIVAIADTFSAMITKRSYRDAFTPQEALQRMKQDIGKFDRQLLRIFEKVIIVDP
ncbi:MAG: HD domain-containing protein [Bacteriovoracaceae bacterium]|nr:HD domain-containing protein [Bacteriovoracaceae bacterium]